MTSEQVVNRMISAVGGIEGYKLQSGQMQIKMIGNVIMKQCHNLLKQIFILEDNTGINSSDIRAKCRRLAQSEKGLGLVVIDYLQLVTVGGKRPDSRQQEVQEISRSLKTMALELKVPVIALAQLSRNVEKRDNNEPMLAGLKRIRLIEQDADIVMFINRKDYYKAKGELGHDTNLPTDIIIAKHQKVALVDLNYYLNHQWWTLKNYVATDKESEE